MSSGTVGPVVDALAHVSSDRGELSAAAHTAPEEASATVISILQSPSAVIAYADKTSSPSFRGY